MVLLTIAQRGGIARRAELLTATGMSPRALDRAVAELVRSRALVRPRRGLVALPDVPQDDLAAASAVGTLTCTSAAQRWGLPLLTRPEETHLAVPSHASSKIRRLVPKGTVLHWTSAPAAGARQSVARSISHMLDCLPLREVVAVGDAALGRGLVNTEHLAAARPRARWRDHERLMRAVDPGSQSISESFARIALQAAGLQVETQVLLEGVGYVDMVVEGVVVEIDGYAYHSDRREFREDRRRDRVITIRHGMPVLRFSFEDAVHATAELVRDVQAAVARLR